MNEGKERQRDGISYIMTGKRMVLLIEQEEVGFFRKIKKAFIEKNSGCFPSLAKIGKHPRLSVKLRNLCTRVYTSNTIEWVAKIN